MVNTTYPLFSYPIAASGIVQRKSFVGWTVNTLFTLTYLFPSQLSQFSHNIWWPLNGELSSTFRKSIVLSSLVVSFIFRIINRFVFEWYHISWANYQNMFLLESKHSSRKLILGVPFFISKLFLYPSRSAIPRLDKERKFAVETSLIGDEGCRMSEYLIMTCILRHQDY